VRGLGVPDSWRPNYTVRVTPENFTMKPYTVTEPWLLPTGHALVTVAGEIDIAAALALARTLENAAARATVGVIADLHGITFIDSHGLAALARGSIRARHLPQRLRLADVPPGVSRMLALTGLDARLDTFPDVPTAALTMIPDNLSAEDQNTELYSSPRPRLQIARTKPLP
jgi:anti-sigma B factor antagonist